MTHWKTFSLYEKRRFTGRLQDARTQGKYLKDRVKVEAEGRCWTTKDGRTFLGEGEPHACAFERIVREQERPYEWRFFGYRNWIVSNPI